MCLSEAPEIDPILLEIKIKNCNRNNYLKNTVYFFSGSMLNWSKINRQSDKTELTYKRGQQRLPYGGANLRMSLVLYREGGESDETESEDLSGDEPA
jgi:hypothetical protein